MLHQNRPRKAFTLLELIVTIVILAVLAAIAVPTFSSVVERSHDRTAEASLVAFAHEVQALAALEQTSLVEPAFETAEIDMTGFAAAGVLAAGTVDAVLSTTESPVQARRGNLDTGEDAIISYALGDGDLLGQAGMAAISGAYNCVGVTFGPSRVEVVEMPQGEGECTGNAALGEVLEVGPINNEPPVLTGLTAPQNLVGAAKSGEVTLTWDSVPGATRYDVYRGNATTAEKTVTDETTQLPLLLGTQATFKVVARNDTSASPPASVTVLSVPDAPKNVTAVPVDGENQVEVRWNAVPGATGYFVYKDGSQTAISSTASGTATSVRVPFERGPSAVFVVKARNDAGLSEPSDPASVDPLLPAPENVTATISGNTATITWTKVPGAIRYRITTNGQIEKVVDGGDTLTTTMVLQYGESASFTVAGGNATGWGDVTTSNTVTAAPAAPVLSGSADGRSTTLTWPAAAGAASYKVYRDGVELPETTETTLTETGLPNGTTYTYRVAAVAGTVQSSSNTVTLTTLPLAPNVTSATLSGSTATVVWGERPGTSTYTLWRSQDGGANWTSVAAGLTGTSRSDQNLSSGLTYVYAVTATNGAGTTARGETRSVTLAPSAPVLTASKSDTAPRFTVNWDDVPGVTSYTVRMTCGAGGCNQTVSQTATSWEVRDATSSDPYVVTVTAHNAAGSATSSIKVRPSYAGTVMSDRPRAYWRFGHDSGNTVSDSSGNNKEGRWTGDPSWGTAPPIVGTGNRAATMTGDDYVTVENLGLPTGSFDSYTVEAWVKWNGTAQKMVFGSGQYALWFASSKIGFTSGNGGTYGASSAGLQDRWVHITAVFVNNNHQSNRLYIDGVKQTLTSTNTVPSNTTAEPSSTTRIGLWGHDTTSAYRFTGGIDDVSVYIGALSDAQVLQHYRAGMQD